MICYFKGLFACATSRATINVPPDQCYERVLAQAFWVLHCLSQVSEYMRTIATLPLVTASLILGHQGRHPVCTAYAVWHNGVTCALLEHGWYDPTTGHQPPPGHELTALECREDGRDVMNNLIPGLGDALSGHVPQTEDGQRLLWYRVVDEEGEETWINGADLPTEADEEDDYL